MDGPLGPDARLMGAAFRDAGARETIAVMSGEVYLELLARDAAAIEFERPVLEARARGESPEVLEAIERAKLLALQVRGTLEKRRRRETELSALFETAKDLAALSDLDSLLQAIVRRVRSLLGTDVAYLTLNDPDRGDTYMRVTEGASSAAFQQVRLRMGEGLGGLVAQTGRPYATAHYFKDERFRHTEGIDSAVADEGLQAILGVPLQLGRQVIGVLYAANRSERPFAREEVEFLVTLAAHAAIAIDNARLLDETRAALAELNAANALVRAHSAAVERAADAHDRLAGVVLHGGGVEDVAATVTQVIGGSLLVVDEDLRPLAKVGDPVDPGPERLAATVARARATGRAVAGDGCWVSAVAAGSTELGALVLTTETPLDEADQRILDRAAIVTALLLLSRRSVAEAESRVRGELLSDLLRQPLGDQDGLRDRARRLGIDLNDPHVVVVADIGAGDRQRAILAATHLAATRGGLAAFHDGRVVLLLESESAAAAAGDVCHELRSTLGARVTAGGAGPAGGPPALAQAHREAARCVDALLTLGRAGDSASAAELGFIGLVLSDSPDVPGFIRSTIGPVLDYDARRGTDLLGTLQAYFANGGNLVRTREALHVHVNTVTQRLERVAQLIGEDWQRPDRALEVQLALRLHRLRSA